MANKLIQLTADTVQKTGLEVYRDISMIADLNQANILKSYKEVVPMAYLSANVDDELKDYYLQGELSAKNIVKTGFNIKAQISDAQYIEEYGDDIDNYVTLLKAEGANQSEISAILTEDKKYNIMLLNNSAEVSALAEWKEHKKWNPYKLAKLVNVKAVFNSIHNIFTWTPGERILNPEFGSNLKKLLYQGITDFTVESIIAEIQRCISKFDNRVNIVTIKNASTINDTENNTIQINIIFTIPTLSREQFIYSYRYKQYDNA